MDVWENFFITSLPKKDKSYSNLNMEKITELDCNHAKIICNDFEVKKQVNMMTLS